MGYIAVSLVGLSRSFTSSGVRPACVTQKTSASKPLMCSVSLANWSSGIRRGKQTSSWAVASNSSRMFVSIARMIFHPYGVQTFIPLTG